MPCSCTWVVSHYDWRPWPHIHPAVPARHVERYHDPVAGRDVGDLPAHLLNDAHRLVAEDVALIDKRTEYLVEVEVRAAERRRRDAHYRVVGFLNGGIGDVIYAHVPLAMPRHCFHLALSPRSH
jgi:hypothetical protein